MQTGSIMRGAFRHPLIGTVSVIVALVVGVSATISTLPGAGFRPFWQKPLAAAQSQQLVDIDMALAAAVPPSLIEFTDGSFAKILYNHSYRSMAYIARANGENERFEYKSDAALASVRRVIPPNAKNFAELNFSFTGLRR